MSPALVPRAGAVVWALFASRRSRRGGPSARCRKTRQLLALFSLPATGGNERCSPDRKALGIEVEAGEDLRLRGRKARSIRVDSEAFAAAQIDHLAVPAIPLLCASPVAVEQLDERAVRRFRRLQRRDTWRPRSSIRCPRSQDLRNSTPGQRVALQGKARTGVPLAVSANLTSRHSGTPWNEESFSNWTDRMNQRWPVAARAKL